MPPKRIRSTGKRTVVDRAGSIRVSRQAASRACEAGRLRTAKMPVLKALRAGRQQSSSHEVVAASIGGAKSWI